MPLEVDVPAVELDDHEKENFAIESAFMTLVQKAVKQGLPVRDMECLMYLPSQDVTQQFKEVCRAVLACLTKPCA
jgi:hypothetical protein